MLYVIPARGGSKGIPKKNIRIINGQPLIAYAIQSAQKSRTLTQFIVSTDSEEIAGVASRYGAEVLMRPPELALDNTPAASVALHALDILKTQGHDYNYVVLLQPTCPLRTQEDIDNTVDMLVGSEYDAVISVYRVGDQHPARMYFLEDGRLVPYEVNGEQLNRQALPAVYHRNGVIYAIREQALRQEKTFNPRNKGAYVMSRLRSINIDEEMDLLFAEHLLRCGSS